MAKILIVDDDPDIVEASQLFLEKEGHTVASAGSRAGGMAQVEAFQPDLLILDVMMEQEGALASSLKVKIQGVWVPVFAGTTPFLTLGRYAAIRRS